MSGADHPDQALLRRTPKRVAQGVVALVAGILLTAWFTAGGGFGIHTTHQAEVIGTEGPADDAAGRWVAVGVSFVEAPATLPAGTSTVALVIPSPSPRHNVVLEGYADEDAILEASDPGSYLTQVTLDPGTYTYWCDIGGHRSAGMEGTVIVR